MELPFTIVFEPPSRGELRALLRMRGHWVAGSIVALTIGIAYLLSNVARADAVAAANAAPLVLSSQPTGATVWVDGRERGATPIQLAVEPGTHALLLKASAAVESQYTLDVGAAGTAFNAVLWRREPRVTRLRAALPGASLTDVRLLTDGQLGLSLGLAGSQQLQAWRLDPRSGGLAAVLTTVTGPRLAFAADGRRLAYIGPDVGPAPMSAIGFGSGGPPASVVWLFAGDDPVVPAGAWRAPLEASEQLVDVSWSPAANQLLVVSTQKLPGPAARSRFWLLDADAQRAQLLVSLPSGMVPGSEVWSPSGAAVAFVARTAELNALCLLGTDGAFRYVADLDPSPAPLLGYPALAWSADGGRMVFVAPHQHLPGAPAGWFQADARHAVYVATVEQPTPLALADSDVDLVRWREDGQLVGLGRVGAEGPLNLRLLDKSGGGGRGLLELPLRPTSPYAAVWDARLTRLLVAVQGTSGGLDYWLLRLGLEDGA